MTVAQPNKCATLRHGGRYGGSLTGGLRGASPSPHLKNVSQPVITPQPHLQLQQHHLQKVNNQEQELQRQQHQQLQQQDSYEDQSYHQNTFQSQQNQQSYNVSTVSKDYNQQYLQQGHYPSSTLPYKKPGSGFTETSSILKKHREEISGEARQSVFTIETQQQSTQTNSSSTKVISIINQPLPEIPTSDNYSKSSKNEQVLSASTLNNYRSLQRPSKQKDMGKPVIPPKVLPPSLPPKNRYKDEHHQFSSIQRHRPPQPLPSSNMGYNIQHSSTKSYEREDRDGERRERGERERGERDRGERTRDRDDRSSKSNRSYGLGEQSSRSSKQQSTFQTLPRNHHHHHPETFNTTSKSASSRKSNDSMSSEKRSQHSHSSKSLQRGHRGERDSSSGQHHSSEMYSMTEL